MTLAGKRFTEEIEWQSRYNVVEIELNVSFVSTGCDNNKFIAHFWLLPVNIVWP